MDTYTEHIVAGYLQTTVIYDEGVISRHIALGKGIFNLKNGEVIL